MSEFSSLIFGVVLAALGLSLALRLLRALIGLAKLFLVVAGVGIACATVMEVAGSEAGASGAAPADTVPEQIASEQIASDQSTPATGSSPKGRSLTGSLLAGAQSFWDEYGTSLLDLLLAGGAAGGAWWWQKKSRSSPRLSPSRQNSRRTLRDMAPEPGGTFRIPHPGKEDMWLEMAVVGGTGGKERLISIAEGPPYRLIERGGSAPASISGASPSGREKSGEGKRVPVRTVVTERTVTKERAVTKEYVRTEHVGSASARREESPQQPASAEKEIATGSVGGGGQEHHPLPEHDERDRV